MRFGRALAAGDFNKTGYDDLAIGIVGEDLETITDVEIRIKVDAGIVNIIYGSSSGLVKPGNQLWNQDS